MKKLIFLCIVFLRALSLNAQAVLWIDTIKYSTENTVVQIATDALGNIFMAGTFGSYYPGPPIGSYIHKYDSNGNLLWADTCKSGFNGMTNTGVAVDKLGNSYAAVWVGSNSAWIGGISYPGGSTSYIIKYSPSGQIQWVVNHPMVASDIGIDNYGYVYLSGIYSSSSGFTAKYDNNGNFISEWPVDGSIAFDRYNNLYLTSSAITKFDPSGNQLWSYPFVGGITSSIDSLGNCYVSTPGAYGTADLIKLNPNGTQAWDISVPYWGGHGIFVKNPNEIYVSGQWGSGNTAYGAIFSKYDANSNLLWSYQMPNSASISPDKICVVQNDIYAGFNEGLSYYACVSRISTPFTTSVKEESNSSALSVYPNPSSTSFGIHYKNTSGNNFTLSIKDAAGKCIRTNPQSDFTGELNETIDLSGFSKGVYFVEISGASIRETKKLVLE